MDFNHRRQSFSPLGLGITSLAFALSAAGCVAEEPTDDDLGEDVAEASEAITGGGPADLFSRQRSAFVMRPGCTATIIGPRHVLTAAHCGTLPNDKVRFYTSTDLSIAPPPNPATERNVVSVMIPPGVDPATEDLTDTLGRFADVAVLRLASDIPATSVVADLGWIYPGSATWGSKVGGAPSTPDGSDRGSLRMIFDQLDTSSDSDGSFLTDHDQADPGDSGGPFYVSGRSVGVLFGEYGFGLIWNNKYSSVPIHLPFILTQMGYQFSGTISIPGVIITGQNLTSLTNSPQTVCEYACDHTQQCVAFNHYPTLGALTNFCQLKKTITGYTGFPNATAGLK